MQGSMRLFFLLSAVVVAAEEIATTQGSARARNHTISDECTSLLNSLLLTAGYSDTCVAAALDTCDPAKGPVEQLLPPIIKEARELLQEFHQVVSQYENRLRNCKDLLDTGDSGEGIRNVYPYHGQPYRRARVYCEQTIDGGGWTVIQRRINTTIREDFSRSTAEYKLGFGNLESEFWLGLDLLHEMTSTILQELRIDLADYEGGERLAKYGFFYVGPSDTYYRLNAGRYSGDAGDSLEGEGKGLTFSAYDATHPGHKQNCARSRKGGWWYGNCAWSNLNGFQHAGTANNVDGIYWNSWRGNKYSLRKVIMMIRPAP